MCSGLRMQELFFGPVCSPIIEAEGSFTSNHVTVIGTAFAAQSDVALLCRAGSAHTENSSPSAAVPPPALRQHSQIAAEQVERAS